MQGMVTPTSSASGAAGAAGNTSMASTLDRLADDLTFTLDRKAETEQGRCEIPWFVYEGLDCCPVISFGFSSNLVREMMKWLFSRRQML